MSAQRGLHTTNIQNASKKCARCDRIILPQNKNVLKALGHYYHQECFNCEACGLELKPKYFPYKIDQDKTILLCQYDYFKKHDLLCYVCDKPLRGLYYTAFGKRYDQEHFSCAICGSPCGVKKCFMSGDQLYCKYHFLRYFSKRCQGCEYPIADQYIELPKGEEIHCWHPECYGIRKYWYVDLSADKLGLPSLPKVDYTEDLSKKDINPTPHELDKQLQAFNFILLKTWSVLYRFEEETAGGISDMFQYLVGSNQMKGISATASFILKVECLFKALDILDKTKVPSNTNNSKSNTSNAHENHQVEDSQAAQDKHVKIARNLSTKIMIYLQLLRKINANPNKRTDSSSFMSVITGLAHFVKLLIRYGLNKALENNKYLHSVNNLVAFLREIEGNEGFNDDAFSYIDVSIQETDNCTKCGKYIQEEAAKFNVYRWHIKCLTCSVCNNNIETADYGDATFNETTRSVYCSLCSLHDVASSPGFEYITRFSQLIYLLKIAVVRSRAVMRAQCKNRNDVIRSDRNDLVPIEETYIRTLNDIKRLKSRRESMKLSKDENGVRKSVIVETAETDVNNSSDRNRDLVISTNGKTNVLPHETVFNNKRTLTLDDISRIAVAEQARELRPNAFTYFQKLKDHDDNIIGGTVRRSGTYYSELSELDQMLLRYASLAILTYDKDLAKIDLNTSELLRLTKRSLKSSGTSNFWAKMFNKKNKEGKKSSSPKIFGQHLEILCEKWGVDTDLGVGPTKIRIPILVEELLSSLRQRDMSVEGVFRKNGNIRRLKELSSNMDSNPSKYPDFLNESAIQLSALLKKFLRELPDPILTTSLYSTWIESARAENIQTKQKLSALAYCLLPLYNRNVLEVLLSFLHWTSSFSHIDNELGSRMDTHNLSTVMAPNILYLKVDEGPNENGQPTFVNMHDGNGDSKGENHFLAIEAVDFLITHNEDLALVPKFLLKILSEIKMQKHTSFEEIKTLVHAKLKDEGIDYSEYISSNIMEVKDMNSNIIEKENNLLI